MMHRFVAAFLLSLAICGISAQDRFRSILIQRACARRPSLDFCNDFQVVPPPVPPTKEIKETHMVAPPEMVHTPRTPEGKEVAPIKEQKEELTPFPLGHDTVDQVDVSKAEPAASETRGNLLRLPKPDSRKTDDLDSVEEVEDVTAKKTFEHPNVLHTATETITTTTTTTTSTPSPITTTGATVSVPTDVEDKNSVLVFVSEYCVVERERFVRNCHGESILKSEIPFCQTYPSACSATPGVIPVISYCQRYYNKYPKHCTGDRVAESYAQFCYAFEQFCLPELTPAQPASTAPTSTTAAPRSSLKRCEDIVDEARKVCNPFPNARDTFNVIRCSQFLTNCKKFVDWA